MPMIACYRRISVSMLQFLTAAPGLVEAVAFPPDDVGANLGAEMEIGEAWQAVNFLLTGDPWEADRPLGNAVLGGQPMGDFDPGYGPVRSLTPEEVFDTAISLAALSCEELVSRFDVEAFRDAEIYPEGWTGSPADRDFIAAAYEKLVDFFQTAAREGEAMLLFLR